MGQEDPLEEGMATHSSILAWEITGTEELGGVQFMGSHREGKPDGLNSQARELTQQFPEVWVENNPPPDRKSVV